MVLFVIIQVIFTDMLTFKVTKLPKSLLFVPQNFLLNP